MADSDCNQKDQQTYVNLSDLLKKNEDSTYCEKFQIFQYPVAFECIVRRPEVKSKILILVVKK